jgi:hypothetical protein
MQVLQRVLRAVDAKKICGTGVYLEKRDALYVKVCSQLGVCKRTIATATLLILLQSIPPSTTMREW